MTETVREKILANVCSELMNIQTANGYASNIAEVRKGLYPNASISNFPTAIISFGNDVGIDQMEGYVFGENELDLAVLVYLNATSENLTEEIENVIKDLYKFFQRDSSIAEVNTSSLSDLDYIRNYRISETSPYVSGANNASVCGMLLKINYTNWIDSTPQPIPEVPTLLSPINGATDGDVNQAFQWTNESNALGYQILIDDGNSEIINQPNLVVSSFTVPDDSLLLDGTSYRWKVRSIGANENSPWSDTWNFKVSSAESPYDSDSQAYFLRTGLTDATWMGALDRLIRGFKLYSIYPAYDAFWIHATPSETSAKANFKSTSHTVTLGGAPTFTVNRGYTGGSPNYLNYNFNLLNDGVNFSQNDAGIVIYQRVTSPTDAKWFFGAFASAGGTYIYNANPAQFYVNASDAVADSVSFPNRKGVISTQRINSSTVQMTQAGLVIGTATITSQAKKNLNLYGLALNNNGNAFGHSNCELAFLGIRKSLTATQLVIEDSLIKKFMNEIGAGV